MDELTRIGFLAIAGFPLPGEQMSLARLEEALHRAHVEMQRLEIGFPQIYRMADRARREAQEAKR